jgi:hypothetical protein
MDKVQSRNRYRIATANAISGNLTGRDVAAITRQQMSVSFSNCDILLFLSLNSLEIKLMLAAQIAFN